MPLPKQKFRELVLLLLYSHDFSQGEEEDCLNLVMQELKVSKKHLLEAQNFRRAVEAKKEALDDEIQTNATSYEFARIPGIERNILRLGAYEILYSQEIPGKVAIAEAIRLARKFASPESATFVNAVLDAIYQKSKDVVGAATEGQTSQ
jgi:N utilization substance protein B